MKRNLIIWSMVIVTLIVMIIIYLKRTSVTVSSIDYGRSARLYIRGEDSTITKEKGLVVPLWFGGSATFTFDGAYVHVNGKKYSTGNLRIPLF